MHLIASFRLLSSRTAMRPWSSLRITLFWGLVGWLASLAEYEWPHLWSSHSCLWESTYQEFDGVQVWLEHWGDSSVLCHSVLVEQGDVRQMHWMTEGTPYSISFSRFAKFSVLDRVISAGRGYMLKNHYLKNKLSSCILHMWDIMPGHLLTFIHTIQFWTCCSERPLHLEMETPQISPYTKNLLARMRDRSSPFSVVDFIWEGIKMTSMDPQKSCGYGSYIIFIEEVLRYNFLIEHPFSQRSQA